ncbi:PDZ domain-containing protein [bacterium]|nr:PDZ domain-containing protein [bacterium]
MNFLKHQFIHKGPWFLLLLALTIGTSLTADEKKPKKEFGYLGVAVDQLDQLEKEELGIAYGILITEVIEDSPAEKAGLQEDDVIMRYHNKKMRRPRDLVRCVEKTEPSSKVVIVLNRDGKTQDVEVVIGSKAKTPWSRHEGMHGFMLHVKDHGYLGVKLQELNSDLAPYFQVPEGKGALILEVMKDSPAKKAEIKAGDVIVALDDSSVGNPEDAREILKELESGDEIACTLIRNGKELSVHVTLNESPFPCRSIQQIPPCGDGSMITVPETDMKELRESMDQMKENMKGMKKDINIKIKSFGDPDVI